jgi:hypothetical protein
MIEYRVLASGKVRTCRHGPGKDDVSVSGKSESVFNGGREDMISQIQTPVVSESAIIKAMNGMIVLIKLPQLLWVSLLKAGKGTIPLFRLSVSERQVGTVTI